MLAAPLHCNNLIRNGIYAIHIYIMNKYKFIVSCNSSTKKKTHTTFYIWVYCVYITFEKALFVTGSPCRLVYYILHSCKHKFMLNIYTVYVRIAYLYIRYGYMRYIPFILCMHSMRSICDITITCVCVCVCEYPCAFACVLMHV